MHMPEDVAGRLTAEAARREVRSTVLLGSGEGAGNWSDPTSLGRSRPLWPMSSPSPICSSSLTICPTWAAILAAREGHLAELTTVGAPRLTPNSYQALQNSRFCSAWSQSRQGLQPDRRLGVGTRSLPNRAPPASHGRKDLGPSARYSGPCGTVASSARARELHARDRHLEDVSTGTKQRTLTVAGSPERSRSSISCTLSPGPRDVTARGARRSFACCERVWSRAQRVIPG